MYDNADLSLEKSWENLSKAWVNSAWHRSAKSIENLFCIFCLSLLFLPGIWFVNSLKFLIIFLWFWDTCRVSSKCLGWVEVMPSSYNWNAALYAKESGSVVKYSTSSPASVRSRKLCLAHSSSLPILVAMSILAKHLPSCWHCMLEPWPAL